MEDAYVACALHWDNRIHELNGAVLVWAIEKFLSIWKICRCVWDLWVCCLTKVNSVKRTAFPTTIRTWNGSKIYSLGIFKWNLGVGNMKNGTNCVCSRESHENFFCHNIWDNSLIFAFNALFRAIHCKIFHSQHCYFFLCAGRKSCRISRNVWYDAFNTCCVGI